MRSIRMWFAAAGILILAASASAQMMGMGGMGMGGSFRGVWNPVVGAGALYEIVSQRQGPGGGTQQLQIAIVGKDTVNGQAAYWMEISMDSPRGGGTIYVKTLYVVEAGNVKVTRTIVQPPGRGPMEMPVGGMGGGPMGGRGQQAPQSADISKGGQDLGSESVTVPAGTFTAEHYKSSDGADVWVSPNVSPWGLVKMTSPDSNMTLLKVVTDAKDMITGTPQVFDPSQMRPGGAPPQQ